jgi:glyoxylase-like metal-dependent hydrolase (beta-lactamase superfamily II)
VSEPRIDAFFHEPTNAVSYLVADPQSGEAAIIDPVLDFDVRSGRSSTVAADAILARVEADGLKVVWILETHVHADHLSAAAYLRQRTEAWVAISEGVADVQSLFKVMLCIDDVVADGRAFDQLLHDGERLPLGELDIMVLSTPGHTPSCVSYRVGGNVFVGDVLFMPDFGTARCDFPGGDPRMLYRSIRRLLDLPPETVLWTCHDYKGPGRDAFAWRTTVAETRAANIHVRDGVEEEAFVAMRRKRDATLPPPALMMPSIQINIRAGAFPPPERNGVSYLKLPLNRF